MDFPIPKGFSLEIASQPSLSTANSYILSNLGMINGSIAYLYSTKPLTNVSNTKEVNLQDAILGYRMIEPLKKPEDSKYLEIWKNGRRIDKKGN